MIKKYLSPLITTVFILIFVYYGINNRESFKALTQVSVLSLFLVAIGKSVAYVFNGMFTKWTAEAFTRKLTIGEGVYVGILSAIGNFFGPIFGGAGIRAVYLKKIHKLSYSNFTATLLGYYLILFAANSTWAIIALLFMPSTSERNVILSFFAGFLAMLMILMFVKLPFKFQPKKEQKSNFIKKGVNIIYDIEHGWKIIIGDKKLLMRLVYLAFASFAATLFVSYVEFRSLGIMINLPSLVLYTSVASISILISLTPGAIGIRETILILVSTTLAVTNIEILQVAVIDRGVNFLLLGFLFLLTRSKKVKKMFTHRDIPV